MKPPSFSYHAPTTLDEALDMLSGLEGALPLAGGQSLIPLLNLRLAHPDHLVDLSSIPGLQGVATSPDHVVIGAMTTHRTLERLARPALLAEAVSCVGFPAIRTRGTLGGSLAHADPAAELPLASLVLDAEIRLQGRGSDRMVAAEDFFLGHYTTARRPDELVTQTRYPTRPRGWGFSEHARRTGDYAVVVAAVTFTERQGAAVDWRVGLAGVADRPVRSAAAEAVLEGRRPDEAAAKEAGEAAAASIEPLPDIHGSTRYRQRLVGVQVHRAVLAAARRLERG